MEKISIISLIYQSTEFAEFVYNSLMKHTPELNNGEAEFYFIANDATDDVIRFLENKKYKYFINNNQKYSENELFKMGYAYPEYINRVYRGYNFGIKQSLNPIIVLINSDNAFSPNWLSKLREKLNDNLVVSPRCIQPHEVFRNPKNGSMCEMYDFGKTMKTFNEIAFIEKANQISSNTISIGNFFMPIMIYKKNVEIVGYYPEGNLHAGDYNQIKYTGDHEFFNKLERIGVHHITINDSICYHFQEGEKKNKI
jgi:hypothetical protein